MKKIIEIGGKPIEFEATGMTNHMVDTIFGGNIEHQLMGAKKGETPSTELIKHIAFVMIKRAELGGWRAVENLTKDDYFDWIDGLGSFEIEDKAEDIMNFYIGGLGNKVLPKNTESHLPE